MIFVWDQHKSRRNLAKHKITFELARLVFEDPCALSIRDDSEVEERWVAMGLVSGVVVLVVVHTLREENGEEIIRIISARKATARERHAYERARAKAQA
jgi:uncharacterized protein